MSARSLSVYALLILTLAVGCASNTKVRQEEELWRHPLWPMIRAAAEMEIARREGDTRWSSSASYFPHAHTNATWAVVASGPYPMNRLGDNIDLLVRDSGEVIFYAPHLSRHPK